MSSLPTETQINITNFIFHVVHHGEETPILMDRTPLGRFDEFFKKRIIKVFKGNQFYFHSESFVLNYLKQIDSSIQRFSEFSKELAKKFHENRDGRIKPGVLIVIKAIIKEAPKYILIKYDNEDVLTYIQQGDEAVLREISNTFSRDPRALQKSAIIDLAQEEPTALVVDRSDRKNITDFFQEYLGVYRRYDNKALTEKVRSSYLNTVKAFRAHLPKEYTGKAGANFYEWIQQNDEFEREFFLQRIFGSHYMPEMEDRFDRELKKNDILGEEFPYDKTITRPGVRKYSTIEGVQIHYSETADDTVSIIHESDRTVITITTSNLLDEDVSN